MTEATPDGPQDAGDGVLRRTPSQKRSRERVETILGCAAEIIAEQGSDALKMSEVAKRAGISIGSLYQYFPDKSAIVRTLSENYFAECRKCIAEALEPVQTLDELCDAFGTLLDEYYAIFLAEPVIRDIRSGAQADKTLQDIELEDSRENGALLAGILQRIWPDADPEELRTTAFFIMHMGETVMRLAVSVDRKEGDAVVETCKRMALAEFRRPR